MSRRSIFTHPDSDASFDSEGVQPATAHRSSSSSSSSSSEESVELLEVVENKCASDFPEITKQLDQHPEKSSLKPTQSGRRFEEAVFAESSSDTGQATVGSSTSSGKNRSSKGKAKPNVSEGSSTERSSQDSLPARRSTRLKSSSDASDTNLPSRRSTRLKSISDGTASTPSQNSSIAGAMDKVNVSSSTSNRGRSSQNSETETTTERILQVRLQRMSIDTANIKVQSSRVRSRKNSTHSETSNGPSPRKSRARIPSTKCLESFNLEDLHLSPRRRTTRKFTPSKKYAEMVELKENRTPKKKTPSKHVEVSDEDDEQMDTTEGGVMKKSTILYDQEADVAGQNLFSFRTPKKRDGMAQLAALAPKTPQTPKTPKHLQKRLESVGTPKTPKSGLGRTPAAAAKTPSRLRSILKRGKNLNIFNLK